MSHYADLTPAPVSPPAHRTPLGAKEWRTVATLADLMLNADYRPTRLRHDRPEVVEALAAEIARRTNRPEQDVRRELATRYGALIHYSGEPAP